MSAFAPAPVVFYVEKSEEILYDVLFSDSNVIFFVKVPIYNDEHKTNVIGEMGIRKAVYNVNIDPLKAITLNFDSIGVYTYAVAWNVPGTKGITEFVINVGTELLNDGSTEVQGVYLGALNPINSNGDFRNYGGSVKKVKNETSIRKYTILYAAFNPFNTIVSPLKN